jgi:glycerol-3-phosphate dehydrogenase
VTHVIIIGGGGTGGALALDLTLRGFQVTLVEKGELLSGTSGRHHGLLHSGARYALHDIETASECYAENQVLRRIAPCALEPNDGLFVALDDADMAHWDPFLERCQNAGIPTETLTAAQALALEPALAPNLKGALRVPDATMDAWRLPMQFFATARSYGARIRRFSEVQGIRTAGRCVVGVEVFDHRLQQTEVVGADLVVNAAGPWAGRVAALADLEIPVRPGPGVMVSVPDRLNRMVINRLQPAGEGDIIVGQRKLSILGTTAWLADDPDDVHTPYGHVSRLMALGSRLIPRIKALAPHAVWCASRPLLDLGDESDPMRMRRTFDCLDHAQRDGLEGLVTLVGGKATTMRAMAEQTADLICRKTGREARCRTYDLVLLPHRSFFRRA